MPAKDLLKEKFWKKKDTFESLRDKVYLTCLKIEEDKGNPEAARVARIDQRIDEAVTSIIEVARQKIDQFCNEKKTFSFISVDLSSSFIKNTKNDFSSTDSPNESRAKAVKTIAEKVESFLKSEGFYKVKVVAMCRLFESRGYARLRNPSFGISVTGLLESFFPAEQQSTNSQQS